MDIKLDYNSKTFNLEDSDKSINIHISDNTYTSFDKKSKYNVLFTYKNITVRTRNIHILYVILQYIYGVATIIDLSKLVWDYSQWNVDITHSNPTKRLSDVMVVVKYILNLPIYGIPLKSDDLQQICPLIDIRGWGGERPREAKYKLGFPLMTRKTCRSLKRGERMIMCPFPIKSINPKRIATVNPGDSKKCFTCGKSEGELNNFGEIIKFERGHLKPHISGGSDVARYQCKWCNTFYKDKITWNEETNKPEFNVYAIVRDAPIKELRDSLKKLGYPLVDEAEWNQ